MKTRTSQVSFRIDEEFTLRLEKLNQSLPLVSLSAFAKEAFLKGLPLVEAQYLPQHEAHTKPVRKAA